MMDAELKAKWIEALRSGKYKQTRQILRDGNGHCCLGVLCEVAGIPIAENGRRPVGSENYDPIWDAIGIDAEKRDGNHPAHELAPMNDTGETFPVIADWIEANL